jgi:hypothetical protein
MADNEDLVDITALIETSASSLTNKNSVLCNKETFDLQDAMAALELMDRKMDCCQIPALVARGAPTTAHDEDMVPPRPLPKGLNDDLVPIPWSDLTMDDASLIAVESLTRLESMLNGASVAESIYTCLYAHSSVLEDMKSRMQQGYSTVAQRAVYALALALVAVSKIVHEIVIRADIYEEEDFSVNTYGFDFFDGILKVESYKNMEHGLKCVSGVEGGRIVELVLHFLLDVLKSCVSMANMSSDNVVSVAQLTRENVKAGVEKLEELKALLTGTKLKEMSESPRIIQFFDSFMYRPLVGNAPMRKVAFLKPLESIPILSSKLSEIEWAACELLLVGPSLGQIRRMLNRFSERKINILARSLMVLNLYFDNKFLGQYELQHLVAQDMIQLEGTPEALLAGIYGQALLAHLAKPVYDMLKLFLLNRNRQQAYLDAAMIPDWAALQQEARAVDLNYCMEQQIPTSSPPYFSEYVLYNLLGLMDHYIALGLELSLYVGHHDLATAYWYREALLSSLVNTRMAMQSQKLKARQDKVHQETKSKGKKRGANKAKKNHTGTQSKADLNDEFDLLLMTLKRNLCRGSSRFIAALSQAELLLPDSFEFTTNEIRFSKRFQPFACAATPKPLTYNDFLVGSDYTKVKQSDLLAATADSFTSAKVNVDMMLTKYAQLDSWSITEEKMRALAKVCVGNSVYLMKLSRQVNDGGSAIDENVHFDFDTNVEFCIIKLV